jgi:formate hydrogenlyase transcriptional activator
VHPEVAHPSPDLQDRLRFETMLSDLSSRFVNLEPAEVDREIEEAQRRVCECLELDLSALWQLSPEEPGVLRMTHLYRPLGGPPIPDDFDAREYNPWALEHVLAGGVVSLPRIDEAPAEAAKDCETWRYFGIKSVFLFPLSTGGESPIGAVSFHTVREEGSWPDEIVQRLQLVSQIFANALVRKRADAALRESEERLQLAAEAAEVGMWMFDVARGSFWATEGAREIFGYAIGTGITMERFLESVHPTYREPVTEAVRRAVEDGYEVDIEYRIVLPDGGEKWVHSRGRMQPASSNSPARMLGVSIDVSERKRSEEELRQAYEEMKKLRDQLEMENTYLQQEHRLQHGSGHIVGESPAIMAVLELVEQVAPAKTTVLVEGETGTGKELIAQRIHQLSPRQHRPMVKVSCAALPSTLVESELFGHEKGAYTGAVSREPGRFEVADGSTIFLDEIAELPLELQVKLLRVLEEGQFERVGSSCTMTTDVRVIAATNRDLRAEVEAGRFRRDLFFRLAVFPIRVPPLRERRSDVPLLVWAIVQELSAEMNKTIETVRREDMERLQSYDWPGNVRELRNVVERALILCTGPKLRIEPPTGPPPGDDGAMLSMDEVQRRHILKALDASRGLIRGSGGAAELLGLKPTTLRSRMERLGLDPRRLRDERSSP